MPAGLRNFQSNVQFLAENNGTLRATGPIVLPGSPVSALQAATKAYVDAQSGGGGGDIQAQIDTLVSGKADIAHVHTIADVTSLQAALDAKAASSHTHAIADSTGLQAALDAKAPTSHSHAIAGVTGLQAALDTLTGTANGALPKAGGTMTGALLLAGNPSTDLEAAPKQYVDTRLVEVGIPWYNAKDNVGGAPTQLAGDDTGDDAIKNEALWALVASLGGGRIYYPRGVYRFSRALQDTSASNTQCLIPVIDRTVPTIMIDCVGETAPPMTLSTQPPPNGIGHSVIKSTLTGASGTACMIGGKFPPGGDPINNVTISFQNMVFQLPANPSLTALDLQSQTGSYGMIEKVLIHDGTITQSHNEPTVSTSYGIKLPPTNQSSIVGVNGLAVVGFYIGIRLGELTEGSVRLSACKVGVIVPAAFHPSILNIGLYGCPYGIYAEGGVGYLIVPMLDIQHDDGFGQLWQNKTADVNDSGNEIHGKATWLSVQAGSGNDHTLLKTGGANFITTELV
jgi:hypothetical protein